MGTDPDGERDLKIGGQDQISRKEGDQDPNLSTDPRAEVMMIEDKDIDQGVNQDQEKFSHVKNLILKNQTLKTIVKPILSSSQIQKTNVWWIQDVQSQ